MLTYLQRKVRLRSVSFSTSTGCPIAVSSSSSLEKKFSEEVGFIRPSPAKGKQALGGPKPVTGGHQGVGREGIFQEVLENLLVVIIVTPVGFDPRKKNSPANHPRSQSARDRRTSTSSLHPGSCLLNLLHNHLPYCSG